MKFSVFNQPRTSSERILYALRKAGKHGLLNYELTRVGGTEALRRVRELRADGYVIRISQLKRGIFRYTLEHERLVEAE